MLDTLKTTSANALAKITPRALVEERMEKMLLCLPTKRETALVRFRQAAMAIAQSPNISRCTPESVAAAVYACARLNLIPDPILKQVYIIPFGPQATVVLGYNGLIDLARRACPSLSIRTGVVYENDDYVYREGLDPEFSIKKRWWETQSGERGKLRFAYCIYQYPGSSPQIVVVSRQELEELAAKSRSGFKPGTPWHDHFAAMGEKTAVKRASKVWTLSGEVDDIQRFREAMEYDDTETLPTAPPSDEEQVFSDFGALSEGEHPIGTVIETKPVKPVVSKEAK